MGDPLYNHETYWWLQWEWNLGLEERQITNWHSYHLTMRVKFTQRKINIYWAKVPTRNVISLIKVNDDHSWCHSDRTLTLTRCTCHIVWHVWHHSVELVNYNMTVRLDSTQKLVLVVFETRVVVWLFDWSRDFFALGSAQITEQLDFCVTTCDTMRLVLKFKLATFAYKDNNQFFVNDLLVVDSDNASDVYLCLLNLPSVHWSICLIVQ
jgi:hypothetical protein